jgi:putative ABC transport system permease protein
VPERRAARRARLPLDAHRGARPSTIAVFTEDVRHALRGVISRPSLSMVVVLTLALGIGANAAIFTVVNGVLLRPLPFADPDQLVMLYEVDPRGRDNFASLAMADDWRRHLTTVTGISVYGVQTANLTGVAEPDRLRAGFVSATFFDMLGVQPVIGRGFRNGEDRPDATKTVVLSYGTWQSRFGGDPSVLGRSVVLNNEPHRVIGVLSSNFEFPIDSADVWMPLSSFPNLSAERRNRGYMVLGRVGSAISGDQALAELRTFSKTLAATYPDTNTDWSARFVPFRDVAVGTTADNLRLLSGAAVFVLLIACANIANLMLVRATGRQREMAVRAALGASRARLVRQLLAECVLMALGGGVLGLLLSATLTDAMLQLAPALPRADRVAPDGTVVLFTLAVSIATGVLFGSLPAWRMSRSDMRSTLNESGRTSDGRGAGRLRNALIVCELALSLMLLVGAGLLVRSLHRVLTVDLGYAADHLLTLEYRLPRNKYQRSSDQWEFHRRVVESIARVPGVETASLARAAAQSGNGGFVGYWKADEAQPPPDAIPGALFNAVTPDFFRAMRIPVFQGRVCDATDTAEAPLTVVINRHLAERLWPGASPIGRQLRSPDIPVAATIVGIVGNTRPQLPTQPISSDLRVPESEPRPLRDGSGENDPRADDRRPCGAAGRVGGRPRSTGLENPQRRHARRRQRANAALCDGVDVGRGGACAPARGTRHLQRLELLGGAACARSRRAPRAGGDPPGSDSVDGVADFCPDRRGHRHRAGRRARPLRFVVDAALRHLAARSIHLHRDGDRARRGRPCRGVGAGTACHERRSDVDAEVRVARQNSNNAPCPSGVEKVLCARVR